MAHLSLDPTSFKPGLLTRALLAASRRVADADLDSALAMAHHPGVLLPWSLQEVFTMRLKTVLPEHLSDLVVHLVELRLGCPWCVDYSSHLWSQKNLDLGTLRACGDWSKHPEVFDETARACFAFAEALTETPVPDTTELAARVRQLVGERGLVEVAYWAGLENLRSRFNASLGLASQGFSDQCDLPSAPGSR